MSTNDRLLYPESRRRIWERKASGPCDTRFYCSGVQNNEHCTWLVQLTHALNYSPMANHPNRQITARLLLGLSLALIHLLDGSLWRFPAQGTPSPQVVFYWKKFTRSIPTVKLWGERKMSRKSYKFLKCC